MLWNINITRIYSVIVAIHSIMGPA